MHVHISALHGLIVGLYALIFFGVMRLMALSHTDSKFWQAWLVLY